MACSVQLTHITADCETSQGGIRKAWLCNYADGIFTVSGDTEGHPTAITAIDSGATFYQFEFRKGTGSLTSTLNVDVPNGINYVSTELLLQFTRQETAKRTAVAALALGGLAGIVQDGNGRFWALGVDEAMYATAGSAQTGSAKTEGNFYQLTLTDDYQSFPLEVPKAVFETITIAD